MNDRITHAHERPPITQRAILVGLLAALLFAMAALPSPAFAENGSVTVTAIEGNAADTFKVYQVFTANVDANDTATHIAWNGDARDTVLAFLDDHGYATWLTSKGYGEEGARENAQNAAEFISEQIAASPSDDGADTDPATKTASSFAGLLARALAASDVEADTASVGVAYTNAEGYYLIVTDPAVLAHDAAATAPIWLALGGSNPTITEKSALPIVDIQVKGVGDSDWSHATDAFNLQDIDYKITGTLPSNIGAFDSYRYTISNALDGMDLKGSDTSNVKVFLDDIDVTASLHDDVGSITYEDGVLCIEFDDILSLDGVQVTKNTVVTVEYEAHNVLPQDTTANVGGTSTVTLAYTGDPVTGQMATTDATSKTARAFSYAARIVKVDKSNKHVLAHAKFTVQVEEYPPDAELAGAYIQSDGSLGSTAYEFETDQDGVLIVPGLDAGTYTIAETVPPEGYECQDSDITLTVIPTIDTASGALSELEATVTGGEEASVNGDERTKLIGTDATAGTVEVQAVDDRTFKLAHTGLEGLSAYAAISAGTAAAGFAGLFAATRRRNGAPGRRRDHER